MTRSQARGSPAPGARRAPFVPVPPPRAQATPCLRDQFSVIRFQSSGSESVLGRVRHLFLSTDDYLVPPSLRPLLGRSWGNHLIT